MDYIQYYPLKKPYTSRDTPLDRQLLPQHVWPKSRKVRTSSISPQFSYIKSALHPQNPHVSWVKSWVYKHVQTSRPMASSRFRSPWIFRKKPRKFNATRFPWRTSVEDFDWFMNYGSFRTLSIDEIGGEAGDDQRCSGSVFLLARWDKDGSRVGERE